MNLNRHFHLEGRHAFLSASSYHWIRYDTEKLSKHFHTRMMAQRGTELHEFARQAIRLKIKMPRTEETLNKYVNDALGFRMKPEQILYYSDNCFGTADALSFRKHKGEWWLRIHDLKTGEGKTSMDQLMIYAAMFCLEYGYKPSEIRIELRIYQNDAVQILEPDIMDITSIMDTIVTFDKHIEILKAEALE